LVEASPYRVNTRGADAHATELLYETIRRADATYVTEYHPDGAITLRWAGDIRTAPAADVWLGRIGDVSELRNVDVQVSRGQVQLTLYWAALRSSGVTDTIFVHLLDSSGTLVGQGDGESLGGLLPPSAWRVGDEILDRRPIVSDGPLPPGEYRLSVGIYDRSTGTRYPAYDRSGQEVPEGALEVARVVVP
jgi:hypothetical protein